MLSEGMQLHVSNLEEEVHREGVPEVFGDDVGDQEVDFFAGVDTTRIASAVMNAVRPGADTRCGLYLHATEASGTINDGAVTVAVAPRFGYAKPRKADL